MPLKVAQEENPYVESFWKWWPELYKTLEVFRMTGGEPLMDVNTYTVLEYVYKNPNAWLELSVTTNMCPPKSQLMDMFIDAIQNLEKIQIWEDKDKFNPYSGNNWYVSTACKNFSIFVSCDGYGKQAEYIRSGLNFNKFWSNIHKLLGALPKLTITIMSTYNIMSPFSYNELIKNVYDVKREYSNRERFWLHPLILDTSYLRYPKHQSVKLLDDQQKNLILDNAKTALYYGVTVFDNQHMGMTETEVRKIKRIHDWVVSSKNEDVSLDRENFVKFVNEHDKRRWTNFEETFPELFKSMSHVW
jgi:organic radical activating enzyme